MALGSQSRQQVGRNKYMYRRRKGRSGKWVGVLFVILVGAVVVWFLIPEPRTTQATNTTVSIQPEAKAQPTITTPQATRAERASQLIGGASRGSDPVSTTVSPKPPKITAEQPARALPGTSVPTRTPVPAAATTSEPTRSAETSSLETTSPAQPRSGVASSRIGALEELARQDPIRARQQLTELLASGTLSQGESARVRSELTRLGEVLLLDPSVIPQDPFVGKYVVQSGDSLSRIAKNADVKAEWMMIKRINRLANPNAIRVGQSLKIPVGTFHAEVSKSNYTFDLFLENEHGRVLVASYPVGLGEFDATPTGRFVVREHSKLINPQWRNPRTGEFFYSNDPENPIGERWIGIKGIDPTNNELLGYGIHGTIDEDSIGRMESMGCIRMHDADVKLVYDALTERGSIIEITP